MGRKPEAAKAGDIRQRFEQAGFVVSDAERNPQALEARKDCCSQYLRRREDGAWAPSGPPYFLVRGLNCELEDAGYQKFWYHDGKRFPIRKGDLEALHRFDQEMRSLLGLKSLYNESLGSTCARTVYDRLQGRPDR